MDYSEPPPTGGHGIPECLINKEVEERAKKNPFPDLGRPPTALEKHLYRLWIIHPDLERVEGSLDLTKGEKYQQRKLRAAEEWLYHWTQQAIYDC